MAREKNTARALQRIAAELGVPVASFYDPETRLQSDNMAMQKAVAALLEAFAVVDDPDRRRHCVALLGAETKRLRSLSEDGDD
jgi:hypothetical protein